MSVRKEAVLKKVLQRLYPHPVPNTEEKVLDSAVLNTEAATTSKRLKLKPNKGTEDVGACGLVGRKVYTVLPPPEDYRPASPDENPEAISTADGTAVDLSGSEASDGSDTDHVKKRRKRRRRKKADHTQPGGLCVTSQEVADQEQVKEAEEKNGQKSQERLSKSKKRNLKKKRQKEKLRSLGLVSQSRALEFTYKQEVVEEKKDDEEKGQNIEEVIDFLRATWNLYLTDRSSVRDSLSVSVAESLFTRLSDGAAHPADISSLCRLRALVGRRDVEQINTGLQELSQTSTMNTDETALICALFRYWITEVLPMQMEKT